MFRRVYLLASLLSLGCGSSRDGPLDPVVRENTRVLSPGGRQALSSASNGMLVFEKNDETAAFAVGQVLASEPSRAAPFGLLRKVLAVETVGNEVRVMTRHAGLHEALQQGEFKVQGTIDAGRVAGTGAPGALEIDWPWELMLYDRDGDSDTTNDQVIFRGQASLLAGWGMSYKLFDEDALFDDLNPFDAMELSVRTEYGLGQAVSVELVIPEDLGFSDNRVLYDRYLEPIVFAIGPVPVVLVPYASVKSSVEIDTVGAGQVVSAEEKVQAGIGFECTTDGCDDFGGFTKEYSFNPPSLSKLRRISATAKVEGHVELYLYGAAGPYAEVEPGGRLTVKPKQKPAVDVDGALRVTLGLSGAWGWDWSKNVVDEGFDALPPANLPPSLIVPGGSTFTLGIKVGLTAYVNDLEDGADCCAYAVRSNRDGMLGSAPSGQPVPVTLSEGQHELTFETMDSDGTPGTLKRTVTVVNAKPELNLFAPSAGAQFFANVPVALGVVARDGTLISNDALPCSAVTWSGGLPGDTLPANHCGANAGGYVEATFVTPGPRTLRARAQDPQGLFDEATVTIQILPAPANGNVVNVQLLEPVSSSTPGGAISAAGGPIGLVFRATGTGSGVTYLWRRQTCAPGFVSCGTAQTIASGTFSVVPASPVTRSHENPGLESSACTPVYELLELVVDGAVRTTIRLVRQDVC